MSGALRSTSAGGQRELTSTAELEEWVASGTVVLFKHSPACWISTMAGRQVKQFSTNFPHITIGVVDVLRSRALSDDIAERYGIRHESPQAIVFRDGEPVWHASHLRVKAEALEEQVRSGSGAGAGAG